MPRTTLDLTKEADAELERLADEQGTTKVEIIRKALAAYSYLSSETFDPRKKQQIAIADANDKVKKIVIIR